MYEHNERFFICFQGFQRHRQTAAGGYVPQDGDNVQPIQEDARPTCYAHQIVAFVNTQLCHCDRRHRADDTIIITAAQ